MLRKFTQTPFFLRKIHPYLVYVPGYTSYLLRRKSYLSRTGWFVTLRKSASIDAEGQPLPWFTYSMIELLKDRLPRNLSIFEYGCGLGTLWWSEYASLLHAVEQDRKSTRLNSSHVAISYAVFCLQKKILRLVII